MKKLNKILSVLLLVIVPLTTVGCTDPIENQFQKIEEQINKFEEKSNEFFRNMGDQLEEFLRDFQDEEEIPEEVVETETESILDHSDFEEFNFVSLAMKKAYSKIPLAYDYDFDSEAEEYLFNRLNAYRKENGLYALEWRTDLFQSSRYKSLAMLQYDYFSHENPNYEGQPFDYLFWDVLGLNYSSIGENLAFVAKQGFLNKIEAEELFKGWVNSPSHNAQMLTNDHKYVGIGVIRAKETGPYYKGYKALIGTQHFGY